MGKKRQDSKSEGQSSTPNLLIVGAVIGFIALGIWFIAFQSDDAPQGSNMSQPAAIQMPHIHGLNFSSDGKQLLVPAHTGLVIFENNQWVTPDLPPHDYMGYAGVDDGFFSSGHPSSGTNFVNPLGLVSSTDGGKTLTALAFQGESDFHIMAVGYDSHAVYILNTTPNSQLGVGLYYSLDEGATWQQSFAEGLRSGVIQIAVHPTEKGTVAAATEQGVFLSTNYGNTFVRLGDTTLISAVAFHPNGENLFWGYDALYQYNLSESSIDNLSIPTLANGDSIAYIALNPASSELAFATLSKNIYLSKDSGQSWQQIASQGKGLHS